MLLITPRPVIVPLLCFVCLISPFRFHCGSFCFLSNLLHLCPSFLPSFFPSFLPAADTPIEEFTPTPAFPALQYLESVDEGGVAWQAGLRTGDFLIEVRAAPRPFAVCVYAVGLQNLVTLLKHAGFLVSGLSRRRWILPLRACC